MMDSNHQSIHVEDARVLAHRHYAKQQHIIRLHAPLCASDALPGQFIHLQCDAGVMLRRPFSIMRTDPSGWLELLYQSTGQGTWQLAHHQPGKILNLLGPIGIPFTVHEQYPLRLLIGGGLGVPPLIFLAEKIAQQNPDLSKLVTLFMGCELEFPFEQVRSNYPVAGLAPDMNLALADMERLGIASRLASFNPVDGCYLGYVTDLVNCHLAVLSDEQIKQVQLFACGPSAMLAAVKQLADKYQLPCQLSLEAFMACAVGGCAGCTVAIKTPHGLAMKRVCVDGPVFNADSLQF